MCTEERTRNQETDCHSSVVFGVELSPSMVPDLFRKYILPEHRLCFEEWLKSENLESIESWEEQIKREQQENGKCQTLRSQQVISSLLHKSRSLLFSALYQTPQCSSSTILDQRDSTKVSRDRDSLPSLPKHPRRYSGRRTTTRGRLRYKSMIETLQGPSLRYYFLISLTRSNAMSHKKFNSSGL